MNRQYKLRRAAAAEAALEGEYNDRLGAPATDEAEQAVIAQTIAEMNAPCLRQSQEATNPWEVAGRLRKAMTMAAILRIHGISADLAREMKAEHWAMAAKAAGVLPPSARTIELIIKDLAMLSVENPFPRF
mgnify:CR=1 FL=1